MLNLVLGVVGDTSLHKEWLSGDTHDYDLFLVYYGDLGDRYRRDAMYYDFAKGTKFLIVDQIFNKHRDLFDRYDAVLIPDDDICMTARDINRFFDIFHRYKLQVAQPAIIGWQSLPITAPSFGTILRYVRCVEIMTPCFSREALVRCQPSFTENKTNWGIDWLWWKMLGEPRDKVAVVDDVVAIHTRPCFFGDTYWRNSNNHQICTEEMAALFKKHAIEDSYEVFGSVPRDMREWNDRPSEQKIFPQCETLRRLVPTLFDSVIAL